jgi:hypothetical protein
MVSGRKIGSYCNDICSFYKILFIIPYISTGNKIAPIECTENVAFRILPLLENNTLRFRSRIISGNFTRGYYMHIIRGKMTCNTP